MVHSETRRQVRTWETGRQEEYEAQQAKLETERTMLICVWGGWEGSGAGRQQGGSRRARCVCAAVAGVCSACAWWCAGGMWRVRWGNACGV